MGHDDGKTTVADGGGPGVDNGYRQGPCTRVAPRHGHQASSSRVASAAARLQPSPRTIAFRRRPFVGFQAPSVRGPRVCADPVSSPSATPRSNRRGPPDCGTIFTWGEPWALGPRIGFMGGWGDHRVLRAGHGQPRPGRRAVRIRVWFGRGPASPGPTRRAPWVLLVGLGWIALMTLVLLPGHRGRRRRAAPPLLFLEFLVPGPPSSVVALVPRVHRTRGAPGPRARNWPGFNPLNIASPSAFCQRPRAHACSSTGAGETRP